MKHGPLREQMWDSPPTRQSPFGRGQMACCASDGSGGSTEVEEVDAARAQEYALLATLLTRGPDAESLDRLARLRGNETPLGAAHGAVSAAAARTNAERVAREHFDLF